MQRLLLCTLFMAAQLASAASPGSGIELHYVDPAVRAQDDFFRHVNGRWLAATEIPPDRPSWGTFAKLREETAPQLRALLEAAQADPQRKPGSDAQKLGDFYASFMDEARIEALGYKPITAELQRIRLVRDKRALPALIAHLSELGVATPYVVSVSQDARDATRYAAHIGQGGLGLPDRDYYLKQDDPKLADIRARYLRHIETTFTLLGEADAAKRAAAVLALENALAQAQWTRVQNRDPVKRYNKVDIAQLDALAPGYDWAQAMASSGVAAKASFVLVNQPSYLTGLAQVLAQAELPAIKDYLEWQLVRSLSPYLSKQFDEAHFTFYGKVLTGAEEERVRWKRAVAAVDAALGEMLGKQYVAKHFSAERKAHMQALVANLMAAYRDSIATLDWMGEATRAEAQAKLAKMRIKIGYPDKWRDYSTLTIVPHDLVGNVLRARHLAHQRSLKRLGMPVRHDEWTMTPQTVNAAYNASRNDITFPAAILQPPFFDASADDAVNYGAIGAVIGHEISHGFDDKGSQSDGDGNLRDWWSAEDRARFNAKAAQLVAQYNRYSPLPGYSVNGELTLGENIADNAGIAIAYKAYLRSLGGAKAPLIDGLSGEQRFFMGFGQVWRSKMREAQQIVQIKTDAHAPGQFRANGSVRNQALFHEAFGTHEGDLMYLAPKDRVTIW